jgi:(p)ppGpp synthase/HD superfamily hydrolase
MKTAEFDRREKLLKGMLLGKGYHKALEAMAFAERLHDGLRKDKVTPEFQHQVEQALHAFCLKDLLDEEGTLITILLHDVREDKPIPAHTIRDRFGMEIAQSVELMTIKVFGEDWRKDPEQYYWQQAFDPRASIAKGTDRIHNLNSMHGVFKPEKKEQYIEEVEKFFIPMLKRASDHFPQQYYAYMSLRQSLKAIVNAVRGGLK